MDSREVDDEDTTNNLRNVSAHGRQFVSEPLKQVVLDSV